ncbi:hypothetical protein SAMN04488490_1814 [Marinobacter sp. LV10R510-11A]|uniref:hypothetical protein n=1 Tax=Marinobacter sp. LV10R510-11A TaxID=1415568 RepID=UPI000BB6D81E|nr:hypothetical protein [Marinobacter sp. LV10R510-11A]SOB76138.1 hypothetical protein SAMN04488490_1814 [Marinobacter sp. LV10R510-11A]
MKDHHSPLAVQEMQILHYLMRHGESHTNDLQAQFEEFETRKQLSLALGNMKQAGLIAKHNPGRWSITAVGRIALDQSGYPGTDNAGNPPAQAPEENNDTWQLLDKIQAQVPENASLVIESGELFFVVAGQKFEIQSPGDFEAMALVADRYIGEVA